MFVKIYLYTIFLSVVSVNLKDCSNTKITVIGTALEDKGGAIVDTDSGYYFLDGLDKWDEKCYGKKVKVTGRLDGSWKLIARHANEICQ